VKNLLITGGTGSFGNAFVRMILKTKPDRVVIYSRDEQKQNAMAQEFPQECMRYFIGDVRDQNRLEYAMHGVNTVIHAAALKIVPIIEYNPTEAVATNVTGAENVVRAAIRSGVKKVIALSTDKAVNPINLYGATKLAAEKVFVAANSLSAGATAFSVVRYGNVAGSRGSVIPFFRKLALENKPLPVTDVRMTRFNIFMDQAIDLVMLCHANMHGREIYIPKIPSFKIIDLVEAFDANHIVVGIRPGEKISECLMTEDESRAAYDLHPYYLITPSKENLGLRVKDGFRYASDTNSAWLTVPQLREIISA
jgi:UDP-N-acetylglucosamine 4,6-dehydratase/5-epimerase